MAPRRPINRRARTVKKENEVSTRKLNANQEFLSKIMWIYENYSTLPKTQRSRLHKIFSEMKLPITDKAIERITMDNMTFNTLGKTGLAGGALSVTSGRKDEAQHLKKVRLYMRAIRKAEKEGLLKRTKE